MANQIIDKALAKIGTLFYPTTNTTITDMFFPCFGVVTNNAASVDIYFLFPKQFTSFTVTKLQSELRGSSGGYIGGALDADLTSYVTVAEKSASGWARIRVTKTGGWNYTNNTPVTGSILLSGTIKG